MCEYFIGNSKCLNKQNLNWPIYNIKIFFKTYEQKVILGPEKIFLSKTFFWTKKNYLEVSHILEILHTFTQCVV